MTINFIIKSDSFYHNCNTLSSITASLYSLFPPYRSLLIAPCLSSPLLVQLGSSSAHRVGQAVRLQWGLWWRGLLRAPEQWCSAGRGEEEQQEATFLHLPHHVPQTHASSSSPASLHGNQRAGPHQLQQPNSSCPNWRNQRGAFLQRTFTGKMEYLTGKKRVKESLLHGPFLEVLNMLTKKSSWQISSIQSFIGCCLCPNVVFLFLFYSST